MTKLFAMDLPIIRIILIQSPTEAYACKDVLGATLFLCDFHRTMSASVQKRVKNTILVASSEYRDPYIISGQIRAGRRQVEREGTAYCVRHRRAAACGQRRIRPRLKQPRPRQDPDGRQIHADHHALRWRRTRAEGQGLPHERWLHQRGQRRRAGG